MQHRVWGLRQWGLAALAIAIFFIAGCADRLPTKAENSLEDIHWQGRLAVKVYNTPVDSFAATFELTGSPQKGRLALYTPLGSTIAMIRWTPASATLQTQGDAQHFDTLETLIEKVTGTNLPVAALFSWLDGQPRAVPGWEADLSALESGRISAHKATPLPAADLKIILDR